DLSQADQADAEYLPSHQLPRANGREQQFDDATRLLLDHSLSDELTAHVQRDEDQNSLDDADRDLRGVGLLLRRSQPVDGDLRAGDRGADRRRVAAERRHLLVEREAAGQRLHRALQAGVQLLLDDDLNAAAVADHQRVELSGLHLSATGGLVRYRMGM